MTKKDYFEQLIVFNKKGPNLYSWPNYLGSFGVLLIIFGFFYYEFLAPQIALVSRRIIGFSIFGIAGVFTLIFVIFVRKKIDFEMIHNAYKPRPAIKTSDQVLFALEQRMREKKYVIENTHDKEVPIVLEATKGQSGFFSVLTRISVIQVSYISMADMEQISAVLDFDTNADKHLAVYYFIIANEAEESLRDFLEYEINTNHKRTHFSLFDISQGKYYFKLPYDISSDENNTTNYIQNPKIIYDIIVGEKRRILEKFQRNEDMNRTR